MLLYLIRHAEPDYARHTLTAAGFLQAKALGRRVAALGVDQLYSSPLPRALLTAQEIAHQLRLKPTILPWTAEREDWQARDISGEVMPLWDLAGEMARQHLRPLAWDSWHLRAPFSETQLREAVARLGKEADAFLAGLGYHRDGLVYRYFRSNTHRVAVVCHSGVILTWLAHLLLLPPPLVWTGYWLAPSSLTTILLEQRSPIVAAPRCLGVGDVGHLYEAGLPVSTLGLKANIG